MASLASDAPLILPERHTDFVWSLSVESWKPVGALAIVLVLAIAVYVCAKRRR